MSPLVATAIVVAVCLIVAWWRPNAVVTTFLVLMIVAGVTVHATAQTTGGGYLGGGDIGADVGGGGGSSDGGGTGGGGTGAGIRETVGNTTHNPFQWRRVYYNDGSVCPAAGTLGPPAAFEGMPTGQPYYSQLVNTDTGQVVETSQSQGCAGLPGNPDPPPPPLPPSAAEARDRTPLPLPTFGVSPHGDGLTNLPTHLWDSNGAGGRDVTASVRGYTVTTHAQPAGWRWTMAAPGEPGPASRTNPTPVVTASHPGTEANPACTYTYSTAGDYTLTLRVTWTGSYTFSGNGVPAQTVDLGTITRESNRDYHVAWLVPVLEAVSR